MMREHISDRGSPHHNFLTLSKSVGMGGQGPFAGGNPFGGQVGGRGAQGWGGGSGASGAPGGVNMQELLSKVSVASPWVPAPALLHLIFFLLHLIFSTAWCNKGCGLLFLLAAPNRSRLMLCLDTDNVMT